MGFDRAKLAIVSLVAAMAVALGGVAAPATYAVAASATSTTAAASSTAVAATDAAPATTSATTTGTAAATSAATTAPAAATPAASATTQSATTSASATAQPSAAPQGARDAVEYVYLDQQVVSVGGTQQIAVGLADEGAQVASATLTLQPASGQALHLDATARSGNAMLFATTFTSDDQATSYTATTLTYTLEGSDATHTIDLTDGQGACAFDVVRADTARALSAARSSAVSAASADGGADAATSVLAVDGDGVLQGVSSVADALAVAGDGQAVAQGAAVRGITAPLDGHLVVAIDPGHGGYDSGATGYGLMEKNLTLRISQYMKAELETYAGVTVYMTRTNDTYVGLQARVDAAVAHGANVFVSVHINSSEGSAYGAEVWVPKAGSYNSSTHDIGEALGSKILAQLGNLGLHKRGVFTRDWTEGGESPAPTYPTGETVDYYSVIRNSRKAGIPGIIVEHAFISDGSDASFMANDANLRNLGVADATGVAQQYGLTKASTVAAGSLLSLQGQVSKTGWLNRVYEGQAVGTSDASQSLLALNLWLTNGAVMSADSNVQTSAYYGGSWHGFSNGGINVGSGSANSPIQGIKMQLTGEAAKHYDVWYRVRTKQYGWLGWAKNGAQAGSVGGADAAQAVEVTLVRKGAGAPGSTANAFRELQVPKGGQAVWRLYNPYTGLHHYTTSLTEYSSLQNVGWRGEGVSFFAATSGSPVYREYNPYNGQHNWTSSKNEHDTLVKLGWRSEGTAWYQASSATKNVYRLYNPYSYEHLYTTSKSEYDSLAKAGWRGEGVGWKGL